MTHVDQNISLTEDISIICEGIVVIPYHTLLAYLDGLNENEQGWKEGFAASLNALECVLEYLKTKDYTITNGDEGKAPQSGEAHSKGDTATRSPSAAFIQAALKTHVEVFLFGLDYDIPELSQEAIAKFERLFEEADWSVDDMMPVIRHIWEKPNSDTLSLRKAVAKLVVPVADELACHPEFVKAVETGLYVDLVLDLVVEMALRLNHGESMLDPQ
ncbi:hypothetical protein PRZ48_004167 [Zasmidium cellare]|uniref:Uncharacterized protein n=1 Tax=Zasmidium cellare TaxID=395010 RepID=A0ABR0EX61_ZASCE|nr:hypothetical protein PRZ48_004167 [Zasmidium cellare]